MCSCYAEVQCCVCRRYLEQSSNRIIVEICGHQKCRECFIKEEDGCSLCVQNNEQFSSQIKNHTAITSSSESVKDVTEVDGTIDAQLIVEIKEDASHIITTNGIGDAMLYKCTICQKTFKSRNNRKYHLFCDKTRSKPFQCNQCDKQFITLAHMNYHQNTHNADNHFECKHCQKVYSGEVALKKHMRKHQNDFKYKCSQCNEKFLYKEQLNIHQNRHNNVFHKCPECGKRFLVKSNLTKHIQSHSGLNRKICPVCKHSFSGNSALKTHMLTHSKSKPHHCGKCPKKFIDQRTLERHCKTHSENAFYECTLCSAKSGRKDNIRRHVRNLHSDSDEELRHILEKIFENFEKKKNMPSNSLIEVREKTEDREFAFAVAVSSEEPNNKKTRVQEPSNVSIPVDCSKSVEVVRPNATSVIKFVGRSQAAHQEGASTKPNVLPRTVNDKPEIVLETALEPEKGATFIEIEPEEQRPTANELELDPIAEIGVNLPSLEPLNYDPFPDLTPLPMINTNTNLTVYRQLLSPYLKKSTEASSGGSSSWQSSTINSKSNATAMVIDRPPKKMIEKYEIYRN